MNDQPPATRDRLLAPFRNLRVGIVDPERSGFIDGKP